MVGSPTAGCTREKAVDPVIKPDWVPGSPIPVLGLHVWPLPGSARQAGGEYLVYVKSRSIM